MGGQSGRYRQVDGEVAVVQGSGRSGREGVCGQQSTRKRCEPGSASPRSSSSGKGLISTRTRSPSTSDSRCVSLSVSPTGFLPAACSLQPPASLSLLVLPTHLRVRTHGVTGRPQPDSICSTCWASSRVGQTRGAVWCSGGCSTPSPAQPWARAVPPPSSSSSSSTSAHVGHCKCDGHGHGHGHGHGESLLARCSSRLQPLVRFARIRPRRLTKTSWRAFPNRRPLPKRAAL